jgi:hypothetical protein
VLKRAYRYATAEIVNIVRRLVQTRNIKIDRPAAEVGLQMLLAGVSARRATLDARRDPRKNVKLTALFQ